MVKNRPNYVNEHYDPRVVKALKAAVIAGQATPHLDDVNRLLELALGHFKGNGSMDG